MYKVVEARELPRESCRPKTSAGRVSQRRESQGLELRSQCVRNTSETVFSSVTHSVREELQAALGVGQRLPTEQREPRVRVGAGLG